MIARTSLKDTRRGVALFVPISKEDRVKAQARITAAFEQVGPAAYLDPKVKRTTETLYVGNLEISTSEEDLYLAVGGSDSSWLRVENVTSIPMADRNMDSLSQVNSRPVYF